MIQSQPSYKSEILCTQLRVYENSIGSQLQIEEDMRHATVLIVTDCFIPALYPGKDLQSFQPLSLYLTNVFFCIMFGIVQGAWTGQMEGASRMNPLACIQDAQIPLHSCKTPYYNTPRTCCCCLELDFLGALSPSLAIGAAGCHFLETVVLRTCPLLSFVLTGAD